MVDQEDIGLFHGFYGWQQTSNSYQQVAELLDGVEQYRDARWKSLREAWVLGMVGLAAGACELRLVKRDPPDGELRLRNRREVQIEIVESMELGRKAHADLKAGNSGSPQDISQWDHELAQLRSALAVTLEKKRQKRYDPGTVLAIYLNTGHDYRPPPRCVLELLQDTCRAPAKPFASTCILWRDRVFGPECLIPGGEARINVWH